MPVTRTRRDSVTAKRVAGGSLPWWHDPSQIRYAIPGYITSDMAEARVMRALMAHGGRESPRAMWVSGVYGGGEASMTAADRRQAEKAAADAALDEPRFVQTRADRGDFDTAMAWFAAIGAPRIPRQRPAGPTDDQRIMWARACPIPLSWREIGVVLGLPHTTAINRYVSAIARIHRIANGGNNE